MPDSVTDPQTNIVKVNRALTILDYLRRGYRRTKDKLAKHEEEIGVLQRNLSAGIAINSLTFTWTGTATPPTITWADGSVQDRVGNYVPIPAGTVNSSAGANLAANTFYWLAWNKVHQVMVAEEDLSKLNAISGNLILAQLYTGSLAEAGTAGGGGSDPGGWNYGGRNYKMFA